MSWNLFLDDIRNVDYVRDGRSYILARSMNEAIELISKNGLPEYITFDHDLGWDELQPIEGSLIISAPGEESPSGYDLAKWLVQNDLDGVINIPKSFSWGIHSSNPVGAKNIHGLLTSYMKSKYENL